MREAAGWLGALGLALTVAAQVAASARSDLLFRDGDSLVVALFARSLLSGEHRDWAMSSVLFLPESGLFAALSAVLPVDLDGLLAINAVVNLLALYGVLRLAAGARRDGGAPVAWALAATTVFGLIAVTETSASRDALELASLLLTTTYYSATVVAVVAVIGVLRRAADARATDAQPANRSGRSEGARRAGMGAAISVALIAAVSTLTNPLFVVWATIPLTAVLGLVMLCHPSARRRMLWSLAALALGSAAGFAARIPFAAWIANTGAGYAQPERWTESVAYYGTLLLDRLSTPLGLLGSAVVAALLVLAVVRTIRAESAGSRIVAASAWILPLLVVVGAIALGTHAARYLQPAVFAPLLALVAAPRAFGAPAPARASRTPALVAHAPTARTRPAETGSAYAVTGRSAVAAPRSTTHVLGGAVVVLMLAAGALSVPRLDAAAHRSDADLDCVTDWVDASGRIGAGQFWTVRLPKAHLRDPAALVQVDHRLNGYAWLVNRTDFDPGAVSFLLEDAQTVPWQLSSPAVPRDIVTCGRYRILDFGAQRLALGPAHS